MMTAEQARKSVIDAMPGDLVDNILRLSDNPEACAHYIASQIRELIEVRLIALVSTGDNTDFSLISLCPEKREAEWNQPEIQNFIISVLSLSNIPRFIDPATGHEGESLLSVGIGKSFVIPLMVGDERVGMLILLDLMDESGVKTILDALSRVASFLALILKNSLLYKNLELRVEERTEELLKKNAELEQSEKRLAQLAEQSRTFSWEVDSNGLYTFVSNVSESVTGYRPEDLVGKNTSTTFIQRRVAKRSGKPPLMYSHGRQLFKVWLTL